MPASGMALNRRYRNLHDLPGEIPVFPLAGALLLPRCELPLNIFEPRYLAMFDAALRGDRMIGMIQPSAAAEPPPLFAVGCAGRLTRFAETDDGRLIVSLTGVCRFKILRETTNATAYRTFAVAFEDYSADLVPDHGEDAVDKDAVLRALRAYAEKNALSIDWASVNNASSETLVNALSIMSPFGPGEKQALLEAADLRTRAEMLVAITELELAGYRSPDRSPLN